MTAGSGSWSSGWQHFWKAGIGAQVGDFEACLAKGLGCAAGGNQFRTCRHQCLSQRDESRLIGNRKQRASNLLHNRALPSSIAIRQVNRQKLARAGESVVSKSSQFAPAPW